MDDCSNIGLINTNTEGGGCKDNIKKDTQELDQIKIKLIKFKAEIVDVNVRCDVLINIDGALLIFDKLFSCLFTDG